MTTFSDLGVAEATVALLAQAGVTEPTAIQRDAMPFLKAGRDAILEAQTGTGKTLAYLLPLLDRLLGGQAPLLVPGEPVATRSLVLVPTPELAMQVRDVARTLLVPHGMNAMALVGGANPVRQAEDLKKGPALVVGTPGRVLDFIRQRKLTGIKTSVVVVDEADELMDDGNRRDLETILKACSPSRQTVFCSATFGPEATRLATRVLKNPAVVRVEPDLHLPTSITHLAFVVDERDKLDFVRRLVRHYEPKAALAFVNRNETIGDLVAKLRFHQLRVAGLSGQGKKLDRASVMRDLRSGKLQMLVATDLAARGLDLKGLTLVLNMDLPTDAQHYVHRAGRTGRMGEPGLAVTLVSPKEAFVLEKLEKSLKITFERPVFSHGEVREKTPEDDRKAAVKAKANAKKLKERAEAKIAITVARAEGVVLPPPKKPKKSKVKGPTFNAEAKGKERKAKRQAEGRFKGGAKAARPARATQAGDGASAPRPASPSASGPVDG